MSRKATKTQTGFTIIELLVATVVFSVLLIVMLAAFIRTGDLFYKGVSMIKTQEDASNIVQSISDDIQFTKNPPINITATIKSPGPGIFCIGQHRYQYKMGIQLNGTPGEYGVKRDNISQSGNCTTGVPSAGSTDEMLDAGMQLNAFNISCSGGRCLVNIHVLFYGGGDANDYFTGSTSPSSQAADAQCKGSLSDTDLCATVDYDSTVLENI